MRWIARAAVVTAILWPGASAAGWRGAEWDMDPEQVAAAIPAAALDKGAKGERLKGKTIGNVGRFMMGDHQVKGVFYYDKAGLQSVALTPDKAACPVVARGVLAELSEPMRISDQVILKVVIWHDAKAANRVRLLLLGTGDCTVYYERLSDYEEIDKRLKAEGR